MEMPLYECHKKVRAVKIGAIQVEDGFCYLKPVDDKYDEIKLTIGWYRKNKPGPNGYYIEEPNGQTSYLNEEAFKRDYEKV